MDMLTWLKAAALSAAALAPLATDVSAQSAGFVVIVNEANPTSHLSAEQLSNTFLKRQVRWPNGVSVIPVDQPLDSPTRQRFSTAVHNRSAVAIRAYWQQQVFSGRDVPPLEKPTDDAVMQHVAETPGGIGYVRAGVRLRPGVRAVDVLGL